MKGPGGILTASLRWQEAPLQTLSFVGDARVTANASPEATFVVPESSLPADFVLFDKQGPLTTLNLAPGMTGAVEVSAQRIDVGALMGAPGAMPKVFSLNPGDSGVVGMDAWGAAVAFEVAPPSPDAVFRARGSTIDREFWGVLGAVLAFVVAFVAIVRRAAPPAVEMVKPVKIVKVSPVLLRRIEPPEDKKAWEKKPEKHKPQPGAATARTTTNLPLQVMSKKQRAHVALDELKKLSTSAAPARLDSLFSADTPADDGPAGAALNKLASALPESYAGVGVGGGGGGTGKGGGGMGTRGGALLRAGGVGTLQGRAGKGVVGGKVQKAPARAVKVQGALDRAEILRVIESNLGAIRNCYERELLARPDLEGKVVFEWVVGAGGAVTSVRTASSTMKDQAVADCIAGLIRRWRFPSPVGGDAVVVYPFLFNPMGF